MCFYISEKTPNALIATEDIVCYKVVLHEGRYLRAPNRWRFVYLNVNYHLSVDLRATINVEENYSGEKLIYEGIHAYTIMVRRLGSSLKVLKAIIPKGTKYYINDGLQEIVAERMIIENPFSHLLKQK